jgi:hypothetical protein
MTMKGRSRDEYPITKHEVGERAEKTVTTPCRFVGVKWSCKSLIPLKDSMNGWLVNGRGRLSGDPEVTARFVHLSL